MTELDRLHDIADDIASASWGYELASALHNIAADIGEKVDGMRRVGEYEDDVLTWVEAYGGLEEVKKELSRFIDRSGYESDALGWVEKNGGLDAVKERLMPEDMEWPRFEDNEQVRIGDHWQQDDYDESITRIDSIEFAEDGIRFENEYADTFYRYGERVKRPAPKVLDADGVEIRVGDTVWTDYGDGPWTVTKITTAHAWHVYGESDELGSLDMPPSTLTHSAPVLAADGKPIREGETVYLLPGDWCDVFPCLGYHGGEELEVFSLHADHVEGGVGCRDTQRVLRATCFPQPSQITHERPEIDSWERWVEDTDKSPCEYFGVTGSGCDGCRRDPYMCDHERNEDLVNERRIL